MDTLTFINTIERDVVADSVKSGVPASITMSQAILESGHGNSMLAKVANALFGIKCAGGWTGPGVSANDDRPNECFRKYESWGDSIRDHSKFLKENSRYKFLFDLPSDDYESWAYGLKKAGYATADNYAQAVIRNIKEFNLDRLDRKVKIRKALKFFILPAILLIFLAITIIVYLRYRKSQLKIAA